MPKAPLPKPATPSGGETPEVLQQVAGVWADVEANPSMHSTLDVEELLAAPRPLFFGPMQEAEPKLATPDEKGVFHLDPSLAPRLATYERVVELGLEGLKAVHDKHEGAVPSNARYTPAAYDLAKATREVYARARHRIETSIPSTSALGREIRQDCGVNANTPVRAPRVIQTRSTKMLEALANPLYAPVYAAADLDAEVLARPLRAVLAPLDLELAKQPGTAIAGEVSPEVVKAVNFVEVAFRRATGFLSDHNCQQEANTINGRLPRNKHGHRATDTTTPPPPGPPDNPPTPPTPPTPPAPTTPTTTTTTAPTTASPSTSSTTTPTTTTTAASPAAPAAPPAAPPPTPPTSSAGPEKSSTTKSKTRTRHHHRRS